MSGLTPEPDGQVLVVGAAQQPGWFRRRAVPALVDLAIVLGWFVVAGFLGALVWWQVTPLAEFTRTVENAIMDEQELAKQVATDGWFVVISAVGGLISGIALLSWRRRDPVLMVVLIALGGGVATWVMLQTGLAFGPSDPDSMIRSAKVGAKIPVRLDPTTTGIYVTWSVTALLGAIGVIWGTNDINDSRDDVPNPDRSEPWSPPAP